MTIGDLRKLLERFGPEDEITFFVRTDIGDGPESLPFALKSITLPVGQDPDGYTRVLLNLE
jgi:hypothetical protein